MTQLPAASPVAVLAELEARALGVARVLPEEFELRDESGRYLGFRLGSMRLLAPLNEITAISPYPELTRVPGSASWLRGISQLRGRLLNVVDLSELAGEGLSPIGRGTRLLVVANEETLNGLIVDEVFGTKNHTGDSLPSTTLVDWPWLAGVVDVEVEIDQERWGVLGVAALLAHPDFASAASQ